MPPFSEGTPFDCEYGCVDLTHRIPIFKNSSYISSTGKRLPGVTPVVSKNLGWNKQALISWANECGLEPAISPIALERAFWKGENLSDGFEKPPENSNGRNYDKDPSHWNI